MIRRNSINYAVLSMAADIALTWLALWVATRIRLADLLWFARPDLPPDHVPPELYVMVTLIWGAVFLFSSMYDPNRLYRAGDEAQRTLFSTALAGLVFAGALYLSYRTVSRALFLLFVLLAWLFVLGWRMAVRLLWRRTQAFRRRRLLILGAGDLGTRLAEVIAQYGSDRLALVGFLDDDPAKRDGPLPVLGTLDDLPEVVARHEIEEVVIALPPRAHERIQEIVPLSHTLPINVRIVPDYFSLALYRATAQEFGGIPLISLRDPAINTVQRFLKRVMDLVIATATLVVTAPLFALTALLIKLDSPGPVFFRQERVGENGRLFRMFKFRTMCQDAERQQPAVNQTTADGALLHKQADDPRITRIGRWLRRTSLDELPQLLNVLKGEMSLVGPRPEMPWLVERYALWQRKRFAVPQGMTGWWQVNGRSDKPMHLHTDEDLFYIQNYSLWLDLYILLKTPWAVLRGRGAF